MPPITAARPGAPEGTPLQSASRAIARSFELTLRSMAPTALVPRLQSLAEAHGGYVEKCDSQAVERGPLSSTLALRIPSEKISTFLPQLRTLAEIISESQQAEEVALQVADTAARLRAKQALEQRLLELFARAHTIDEMLKVEAELARVRTEIEQLSSTERGLQQRVNFVLFQITLVPTPQVLAARERSFGARLSESCLKAFSTTQSVVLGAIEVLGVLAPLALLLTLAWCSIRWWLRRGKRLRALTVES